MTNGVYTGDTEPKLYVGCWPSWTGGNWKATRTVPSDNENNKGGGGGGRPITGGKLAGIIIGAVVGLAVLVAIGISAAMLYRKLSKALVVLEGQVQEPGQGSRSGGTDKEVGADVTTPETAVHRPPRVQPLFVGNALLAKDSLRHDSVGTISNASAFGIKQVTPRRVSGSSEDEILQEVPGHQEEPHELDVQRPRKARLGTGGERVRRPYFDAHENLV
jgi:hypothetical protein